MEGTIGKEGEVEKENWGGKIVKRGGVKKGPTRGLEIFWLPPKSNGLNKHIDAC